MVFESDAVMVGLTEVAAADPAEVLVLFAEALTDGERVSDAVACLSEDCAVLWLEEVEAAAVETVVEAAAAESSLLAIA